MNLSVNSKIFYPVYGAGWIISRKVIDFAGKEQEYLEFKFVESNLVISTPISNLENLGIRKVNDLKVIEKALQSLKKKSIKKPPTKDYNNFIKLIEELVASNNVDDFVTVIRYCRYVKEQRKKEGRLIPTGIINNIKKAFGFLVGEYAINKDIDYTQAEELIEKEYDLTIDSLLE